MRGLPRTRVSLPATYPRKRGPRAWHTGVRQTAQRLGDRGRTSSRATQRHQPLARRTSLRPPVGTSARRGRTAQCGRQLALPAGLVGENRHGEGRPPRRGRPLEGPQRAPRGGGGPRPEGRGRVLPCRSPRRECPSGWCCPPTRQRLSLCHLACREQLARRRSRSICCRCDPPHASTSRCVWREGVARGNEGAPLAVCSFWGSPSPSCTPPRTRCRSALLRVSPLVAVTRTGEPGGARLGRLVPPCCWYAFARRGRLGAPPK